MKHSFKDAIALQLWRIIETRPRSNTVVQLLFDLWGFRHEFRQFNLFALWPYTNCGRKLRWSVRLVVIKQLNRDSLFMFFLSRAWSRGHSRCVLRQTREEAILRDLLKLNPRWVSILAAIFILTSPASRLCVKASSAT